MTINGTKLSVRLLGATLALAACSLLAGNAQAQNRLFVSLDDNSIVSYDISLTSAAAVEASKTVFTASNLSSPHGIAFDSSGNLYAANNTGDTISKFDSSGSFLFSFNTPSGTNPGFLTIGGSGGAPPPAVPEPGAVAFGIIAVGSVLGLVARKRRS